MGMILNSLRSNDAYMREWIRPSLVQIRACHLVCTKNYLNQCYLIVNLKFRNKFQWNPNWNSNIFIEEHAFENVIWKMAAILSRPQCVKMYHPMTTLPVPQQQMSNQGPASIFVRWLSEYTRKKSFVPTVTLFLLIMIHLYFIQSTFLLDFHPVIRSLYNFFFHLIPAEYHHDLQVNNPPKVWW